MKSMKTILKYTLPLFVAFFFLALPFVSSAQRSLPTLGPGGGGGAETDSGGDERDSGGFETDSGGDERDSGGFETDSGGDERDSGDFETDPGDTGNKSTSDSKNNAGCDENTEICNPLRAEFNSIPALIEAIITRIVIPLGAIVVAMALIWSGFLFVTAQGSEEKLVKAKKVFTYTVIGATILLGAWAIVEVITGTICQIAPDTPGLCD